MQRHLTYLLARPIYHSSFALPRLPNAARIGQEPLTATAIRVMWPKWVLLQLAPS